MKCPNCNYLAKGSICDICDSVIFAKPEKVKVKKERKPINKVSKKMSSDLREYGKLRKQFLLDNPMCRKYPDQVATDIHHSRGRGKYLLDTTTWIPLSRKAHIEVEGNPLIAKSEGYSLERLKTTI